MTMNRIAVILTLALAVNLPLAVNAQNEVPTETRRITTAPAVERPYRVLLIRKKGNKIHAYDPASDKVVFRQGPDRRHPFEVIEWALHSANVTAVMNARIELRGTVNVPVSNTSLIIGPNAELVGPMKYYANNAANWFGVPNLPTVIRNTRLDHVNIFNLGIVNAGGTKQTNKGYGIVYDGRNGGKNGINGGILFSTGSVENMAAAFWIIDSANVTVPMAWGRRFGNCLVTAEGNDDLHVGFAAGLLPNDAAYKKGSGEVVDVQPRNRRARIDHIIGTLIDGREEVLDVNNSPNTWVGKAVGYGKVKETKKELIGKSTRFLDVHKYGRRYNRRATQKHYHPYFRKNSPGTELNNTQIVNKDVKEWKTTVKTPGFPDSLPVFKVQVRLKAVFEDGSTEQVFAKNYRFEL